MLPLSRLPLAHILDLSHRLFHGGARDHRAPALPVDVARGTVEADLLRGQVNADLDIAGLDVEWRKLIVVFIMLDFNENGFGR